MMGKRLQFVDLAAMHHLMDGLSFKVHRCAELLDGVLAEFNSKTRIPERIIKWNERGADLSGFPIIPLEGRLIVEIEQSFKPSTGQTLHTCVIRSAKEDPQTAPVVFFTMWSPSLDIPMRVEVPLRALVKGGRKLKGTYVVYLHALLTDRREAFVYYGITKRGWNTRFTEHVNSSLRDKSRRLFPQKMGELIDARAAELSGIQETRPKLAGMVTALCAIGLTEQQAMDTEEYLVDKYSLSSKHTNGLNMIPGGYEGIRSLHALSILTEPTFLDTEAREEMLDGYLRDHPKLGIPNPGVAAKWNDPEYAEAVICGRENRLEADQVREIRYLAALGYPVATIRERVGAVDEGQVQRVLQGRTYARIH
jgi:hypothetical protein